MLLPQHWEQPARSVTLNLVFLWEKNSSRSRLPRLTSNIWIFKTNICFKIEVIVLISSTKFFRIIIIRTSWKLHDIQLIKQIVRYPISIWFMTSIKKYRTDYYENAVLFFDGIKMYIIFWIILVFWSFFILASQTCNILSLLWANVNYLLLIIFI